MMINHSKSIAAFFAAVALSAPMLSQAQDPNTAYAQIQKLTQAGKNAEALELSNKMVKMLSDPRSRVVKQFNYMLPFFLWQNASILHASGEYRKAADVYREIAENKDFRSAAMIKAAKSNPGKPLDYTPFFTSSAFQVAYCLFNLAAGTEDKDGDPTVFPEAITALQNYIKIYNSGKVTPLEKKQELGAKTTFLLLQAYLLQPTPDFVKAEECFEQTRKSDASLPDDMVMNALATIVKIVEKSPEHIGWIDKIIESSRDSYDLGVLRGAKYGDKFLNHAIKSGTVCSASVKEGKSEDALSAARSAMALYSLVPDVATVQDQFDQQLKCISKSSMDAVPDLTLGVTYSPVVQKKIAEFYKGLDSKNQQLEGMSLLGSSAVVLSFGANRLGKASYQILIDRYPDLAVQSSEGKLESMNKKNLFQLSQLARLTGDVDYAVSIEKQLEASGGADGNSANTLLVNKMGRFVKAEEWDAVITAADEVIAAYQSEPDHANCITAKFCKIAAMYKLHQYDELLPAAEEFLKLEALTGELEQKYESQCLFFALDSCNKLGLADAKKYDRCVDLAKLYEVKYSDPDLATNPLYPNVCYSVIDTLLRRRGHGDEEGNKADLALALEYCNKVVTNWPTHSLCPVTEMLAGNILINGEDDAQKPEGIKKLETALSAALALEEADKATASNALFWLLSYAPEIAMPGEKPVAKAKRLASYQDTFWTKVDRAGDKYCFPIARLNLKDAIASKDEAKFDAAVAKMLELLARESKNNVARNVVNEDVQEVFFDFVDQYYSTMKSLDKELDMDQKVAFIDGIKGIDKADHFTRSILDFCKLDAMNVALAAETDSSKRAVLETAIAKGFREMTQEYQPEELSNFLAVQVGDALLNYVAAMPETRGAELKQALSYYDKAINDVKLDQRTAANLGKANALSISASDADRKAAVALYQELVASEDYDIMPEALAGLSKMYMATGDYMKAIETGAQFLKMSKSGDSRLDMLMLMGQAYDLAGDTKKSLATYMNLYNQNRGRIDYSAPACVAIMDVMWKRNNPATGDRLKGDFKASDKWTAWSTGQDYVTWIDKAAIEPKMTPAERDKYRVLRSAVEKYSSDSTVQAEDKAKRDFDSKVNAPH